MHGLDHSLESLLRRDAAEVILCAAVFEVVCAIVGFAAWKLL